MRITKSLKKSAVVFSLIAVVTYGIVLACGSEDSVPNYSSFTPEAHVDELYTPLFFDPDNLFYGETKESTEKFHLRIHSEWSTFLEGRLDSNYVWNFLLGYSSSSIKDLYAAIQQKERPTNDSIDLNNKKVCSFIEFMHYANIIQQSSSSPEYSWDYDTILNGVKPVVTVEVEKKYSEASSTFLKNRYWFQVIKARFYSDDRPSAALFFEKTKEVAPKNHLYYRAMAYVAGAYYAKKDFAQSNYYYSQVFDQFPELLETSAYSFHPGDGTDIEAAMLLAKSNREKVAILAMAGFYGGEKKAVEEIYKLDPKSHHLDFLLTRLVNKRELKLNVEDIYGLGDEDPLNLITSIAREGKTNNPHLWNLAAGYLNILAGNKIGVNEFFAKAAKAQNQNEISKEHFRLLSLINKLFSLEQIDAKTELELLPELNWLYHESKSVRYDYTVTWSKHKLSLLYTQQGQKVMAELFQEGDDFYGYVDNEEAMKTFLQKQGKTPWEQMAVKLYQITIYDIFEYQGITNAYHDLDKAIEFMAQASNKETVLKGNPFNGKIKDCHDCDHAAPQRVQYTKLSFLMKMKEMKNLVDTGVDVYNNSLLLGNAYYNMTYYGNARLFYYNRIKTSGILDCSIASEYYKKAFAAAVTNEQKAKCEYMLAKCERNDYYTQSLNSDGDYANQYDFLEWDGFKQLKTKYSKTNYYKEVIKECGYFKTYIEQGK